MRLSRRGWNNVIIIGVVCFIAVIRLPELLQQRFATNQPEPMVASGLTRLLPEDTPMTRLSLPQVALRQSELGWLAEPPVSLPAATLAAHWQRLEGTPVNRDMMAQLQPTLQAPRTAEIWLASHEEPVRVTIYQLPQFWLLQNWQGEWLAVSVDEAYLFPRHMNPSE